MTKRMLIDATHAEETRVVVLDGSRLEDFDVETSTKKQLKGNIYLARIVRVEPSLQAAFVEYGGNRHGFLAFGEIHPDYYQIPVADRQRLIAQQEQEAREAEEEEDAAARADEAAQAERPAPTALAADDIGEVPAEPGEPQTDEAWPQPDALAATHSMPALVAVDRIEGDAELAADSIDTAPEAALIELGRHMDAPDPANSDDAASDAPDPPALSAEEEGGEPAQVLPPESVGGENEERERRTPAPRFLRHYKIQEVMRRRQILLVQVVKEERGGKGAALTTYISLAGRFSVLMPNSPRGGGISRKITSAADRRRLKEVTAEIGLPSGMGLIVRTAGAARPKPEIVRDCEYLLQLWDDIRQTTLKSMAPALIYEEASLIKRAIRDVYSRDVDEVLVDGEQAWRAARDQMRLLMPSHASKVQLWQDASGQKLFARHAVDAQLDAMLSPTVQLRSGGYLVINQTEALVAIDVNSGRSTRERGIEETALRTNLEAAEEVARQLRLRDLAGLIVIDFIDMEVRRNNAAVERKLKDALKDDRARIQVGIISPFGLMEMSRQRLRPSLAETSFVQCAHCSGTGLVRSTDGAAIHVLRAIEEEGGKRRAAEIMVHVAGPIAMYILNHKRERLREIEARYGMVVLFEPDPTLLPPAVKIDKLRAWAAGEAPVTAIDVTAPLTLIEDDTVAEAPDEVFEDDEPAALAPAGAAAAASSAGGEGARAEGEARRRRRRRRRGGRREDGARVEGVAALSEPGAEQPAIGGQSDDEEDAADQQTIVPTAAEPTEAPAAGSEEGGDHTGNRRRGRRGGRRRRKGAGEPGESDGAEIDAVAEPVAAVGYVGPTPADPFGGGGFDIFDVLEQAEARAEAALTVASPAPVAEPRIEPVAAGDVPVAVDPPATPHSPAPAAVTEGVADAPAEAAPLVAKAKPRKPRAGSKAALAAAAAAAALAEADAAAIEPEPEPQIAAPAATEPPIAAAEPLARPVLVQDVPDAPKRGWWRR